MHKLVLLLIALLMVAGCAQGTARPSPSPSPTAQPSQAPIQETATPESTDLEAEMVAATCELAPLDFPVEPRIPPVTADDHVHGPADAAITFVEYSDFQ